MDTIETILLTKTKKVRHIHLPLNNEALYEGCFYSIDPSTVSMKIENEKLKGVEIIIFEGRPNPVGAADTSKILAEKIVYDNLIENSADAPKPRGFNKWLIIIPAILIIIGAGVYGLYLGGYLNGFLGLG